jgi:inward rectifier potassium channel
MKRQNIPREKKGTRPQQEEPGDLGLGSKVAQESHERFLNKNGTFSVQRKGLGLFRSLSLYHWLLTISWTRFILLIVGFYFIINLVFAFGYYLCGQEAFAGVDHVDQLGWFLQAFFFSVQTVATIGYGRISPANLPANILVTIDSLVGLLGLALITGILFSRFSRPSAKILFSHNAIIAPYRGITAFEFRIANERSNQLIEVNVSVTLSRFETEDGKRVRRFHLLSLERKSVVFFPLNWTIVHPIDETSPLYDTSEEELRNSDAEFLVLITAIDETFSQTVHARSSYKHHEVIWGARFSNMFHIVNGKLTVDLHRIHDAEHAPIQPSRSAGLM